MTINLENPAMFVGGEIVKLHDDLTATPMEIVSKSADYMRLITEPIDLIPGPNDANKNILHLKPGDILLTFSDYSLEEHVVYYRIVINNDTIADYLTRLTEYKKKREKERLKESCCCSEEKDCNPF